VKAKQRFLIWLLLWLCLLPGAQAELNIEITQGVDGALPVAIIPFGWESPVITGAAPVPAPLNIAEIVSADLFRSGRFTPLSEKDLLARPTRAADINFKNWRILGTENLVVGRMRPTGPGNYIVEFQLFNVFTGEQLAGYSIPSTEDRLRHTAHRISDLIYEKLTGQRGAFATKVAYVVADNTSGIINYTLRVADADGFDPQVIVTSDEPIMSPAWSPDAKRIAYVSFESGRSAIYVQDINTGLREIVSNAPGMNQAPAWSPDGTRLAISREDRGNPDIYILNLASGGLHQLTRSYAIDTEPNWSPDGKSIIFTSDRGGNPQIYQISATGTRPQRLTFEGKNNGRASYTRDGRHITLVTSDKSRDQIATLEVESGLFRVLTKGALDESPSFAPNGSMIIYATEGQGQGILAAVSTDGRVHQRLALQEGDVREPAWSPYITE